MYTRTSFDSKSFEKAYKDKLPRYFEDFVRDALAEKYEGKEELMLSPEVSEVKQFAVQR